MNVLLVAHSLPTLTRGGVESHVDALAAPLADAGHRVSVLCAGESGPALSVETSGPVHRYCVKASYRGMRSYEDTYARRTHAAVIDEVFARVAPEVVHVHSLQRLGIAVVDACRTRTLPLVLSLHDFWLLCPQGQLMRQPGRVCADAGDLTACSRCVSDQLGMAVWPMRLFDVIASVSAEAAWRSAGAYCACRRLWRGGAGCAPGGVRQLVLRRAAMQRVIDTVHRFLAPSDFVRRAVTGRGIPGSKIVVLPLGVRRPGPPKVRCGPVSRFSYAGNLSLAKGVHVLIEAFRRLPYARAELYIYGKAYAASARLVDYAGLLRRRAAGDRRIYFRGVFERAGLERIMGMTGALVVPSLFPETFSLAAAEAVAHGVPVIASRIGALPETVREGIDGLLFEPGDTLDLERQLRRLGDTSFPGLSQDGSESVVCSMEDHAERLLNVYAEVVRSSRESKR